MLIKALSQHFPSFEEGRPRRTNLITLPKTRRGRGGQTLPKLEGLTALPVCAAKERDHFLNGAATPPQGRGCALNAVCSSPHTKPC